MTFSPQQNPLNLLQKVPKLPLSALIFYVSVLILWKLGIIPSPAEVFLFLERLYDSYGLLGLFIGTLLEGIVYLGLYFPGFFIIALAAFVSDGGFFSLLTLSVVVALTLTLASAINYSLGRFVVSRKLKDDEWLRRKNPEASTGLFLSMLHPNALAFYFFNLGLKKRNPWEIIFVPVGIIPYGIIIAYIFFLFKAPLRKAIENPFAMITIISTWLIIATILKNRKNKALP